MIVKVEELRDYFGSYDRIEKSAGGLVYARHHSRAFRFRARWG